MSEVFNTDRASLYVAQKNSTDTYSQSVKVTQQNQEKRV